EHWDLPPLIAATGLAGAASVAAWLELSLLSRSVKGCIGVVPRDRRCEARIVLGAVLAGASAIGVHRALPWPGPGLAGSAPAGVLGRVYCLLTRALAVPRARAVGRRLWRRPS